VEVQEDAVSGRIRTTVKDAGGRYLPDVHVKVIGTRNSDFTSGATDLRGVFVADGIKGTSTVIAQADPARYAFFRGQTNLEPQEPAAAARAPAPPASPASAAADRPLQRKAFFKTPAARASTSLDQQLLQGLQETNQAIQGKQVEELKMLYKREQKGVEAQKAY